MLMSGSESEPELESKPMSESIKKGWQGRFFEDFEVGDVYQHLLGRTVTTTDNK